MRLELNLLRHVLDDPVGDEVRCMIHGATFHGANTVDERDLLESVFGWTNTDRPTVTRHRGTSWAFMHLGIGFKVLFGENVPIELHLTVLCCADVGIPNLLENL